MEIRKVVSKTHQRRLHETSTLAYFPLTGMFLSMGLAAVCRCCLPLRSRVRVYGMKWRDMPCVLIAVRESWSIWCHIFTTPPRFEWIPVRAVVSW